MRAFRIGIMGCLFLVSIGLQAQYFGQNKPHYEDFEFKVSESPHFEIYHYLQNDSCLQHLTEQSEQWYDFHQRILRDTLTAKNPLIFYNDHADFQQTNVIGGQISTGTGGVTEGLRNRVIMPLAMSNQQTNHVLGHELVHAFQFHMIINGESTSIRNMANLPLWLVEGLAEYMSIGSVDPHTAMWMRDAVLNNDIPTIRQLSNPKYFPYRYGQAFWAFLTGWKGDQIIEPFFMGVAKFGLDEATVRILGIKRKDLSTLWVNAMKKQYAPYLTKERERTTGKKIIDRANAGRLNIAPVISPNGRYLIFLSEKDLFATDLYLADARNGEIIRKVASAAKDGHIDDFNYIESAGTWSPNSKQFAYVAFSKGRNILVIKEVETGKTVQETPIEGVPAFSNPTWSPDKKTIVVTGLVDGQTDLYAFNIKNGSIRQLTNDRYSELHASWSPDGTELFFSTDQLSFENGRTRGKWTFNLAVLDVVNLRAEQIPVFPGADNLNPVVDTASNILFLSDRDGFRNIYKYERNTKKVFQLTDFMTGVSGITPYAPAMSIDRKRARVVFSHYLQNGYDIYTAKQSAFLNKEVDGTAINLAAAELPTVNEKAPKLVDAQLGAMDLIDGQEYTLNSKEYKPKFELEHIANSGVGVGVGTSQNFGTTTGLVGGVNLLFGDVLGHNKLVGSLSLNGEITDLGGGLAYLNQKGKIAWGGSISHMPFRSITGGFVGQENLPIDDDGNSILVNHYIFDNLRIFQDQASIFAQLPFSKVLRLEAGASFSRYSFRIDRWDNYYDAFGRLVAQERERLDNAPSGFNLWSVNAALVGDNSTSGVTAPLRGYRYRLGVEQNMGEFNFTALTADFRTYKYLKPVTLAFRGYHYGRYGSGADGLFPLFVGSPWFVRGYNSDIAFDILVQNGQDINSLQGSKLFVSNFEVRIPFTGPERLSVLKSKFLLSDLNFFVDGGVAFNNFQQLKPGEDSPFIQAQPVFSAGASVRVNVFGAMILEPYYAFPLQKNTQGVFGLNIIPGW